MSPPPDSTPPDPFTGLAEAAGALAELFKAYTEAGIPATYVAIMLGQWMAATGQAGEQPGDGS